MKYLEALERLQAAQQILADTSISKEKFGALQKLLKGVNPNIDKALSRVNKEWDKIQRFEKGEVIDLVVHGLPENTEEEKKRKKALLFFLSAWKDLKNEVARVKSEFEKNQSGSQSHVQGWGNILGAAKGPLGLITVIAVGWVLLEATAVEIAVRNVGCDTIYPTAYSNIPIPGISLPKEAITDGGEGIVKMPPITLDADGATPGSIRLSAMKFNYTFDVPRNVTISFNGNVLNDASQTIELGSQKRHTLLVSCL